MTTEWKSESQAKARGQIFDAIDASFLTQHFQEFLRTKIIFFSTVR